MPKRRIIPYRPKLKTSARRLRTNQTPSEARLWSQIRRQRLGVRFYRQRPVDQYIVDFYAPDCLLAIEVDGRSHDGNLETDLVRQRRLESLDVRVLRFSDQDVMRDLDNVILGIRGWIEEHALSDPP